MCKLKPEVSFADNSDFCQLQMQKCQDFQGIERDKWLWQWYKRKYDLLILENSGCKPRFDERAQWFRRDGCTWEKKVAGERKLSWSEIDAVL